MATDNYSSGRSESPESCEDNQESGLNDTITIRFIANSREVGSIIGRKGDNVKRIREESGSRLNISDSSSPERIVTISGSTTEILKAFSMICAKFEQEMDGSQSDGSVLPITIQLIIPNNHCGSLIGKGGSNIKDLREATGATIQVANDMLPHSNERMVTISGSMDAVMQCIQRLCVIAAETKALGSTVPYQPQKSFYGSDLYNSRTGYGVPGLRSYLSQQPGQRQTRALKELAPPVYSNQPNSYSYVLGGYAAGGRTHTQELFIPNHRIGSVIGKAGSRINGIRQSSQALIKIDNLEEGATSRRVTITGTPASVNSALFLIHDTQLRYGGSAKRM